MRLPFRLLAPLLCLLAACSSFQRTEDFQNAREAYTGGRYFEAESLFETYLQKTPKGKDRWEAWNCILDVALSVRGDYEKAANILEAMLLEFGSRPDRAWPIMNKLAQSYETLRLWDKAVETWQKCLNIPNVDVALLPDIQLRLAKIHQGQRDYDLAQKALRNCVQGAKDPEVRGACNYELAQTLLIVQKSAEAQAILKEIQAAPGVDKERKALSTFLLADIAEQKGDVKTAITLLQTIAESYPNPKVVEARLVYLKKSIKQ